MTPEMEGWKEVGKDLVKALGGGIAVALALLGRRHRRAPLSIAPESERFSCTREEWDELMSKVAAMQTDIALHEQEFERVREDRAEFKAIFSTVTSTLQGLDKGIQAIQLQLARMGAPS